MEKILTYINDRKWNLSVVSSFSHFVELFLIWCSKTIREKATASLQSRCLKVIWSRERLGPMTETCKTREPPLPACFSEYNEVFNSNSHWDCLPIVLCRYSNRLSVLNVLLRWLKSFDCKLYAIFHFFFLSVFLFCNETPKTLQSRSRIPSWSNKKNPESRLSNKGNPGSQKTYRGPSTKENQSWNWRNEVRVTLSR